MLSFLCAIAIMIGCTNKGQDTYTQVTAKGAYDTCKQPLEVHDISPYAFPIAAKVHRHVNCLGIPDMLLIVWYGDRTEKNEVAAKLLALMYVTHYNDTHPDEIMTLEPIKTEQLKVDEEKTYITFNVIKVKKKPGAARGTKI
jgi:hypothetical protein